MKKKIMILGMVLFLFVSLVACDDKEEKDQALKGKIEQANNKVEELEKHLVLPTGAYLLEPGVFESNTYIESLTIGSNIRTIMQGAFKGCTNLAQITFPEEMELIEEYAFDDTKWLEDKKATGEMVIEGKTVIWAQNQTGDVIIPEGVKYISPKAFLNSQITSVSIPDSVVEIGDAAFEFCRNLTSVTIPESISVLNAEVFSGCSGLTEVNLPTNMFRIEVYAFHNCTSLKSITIPETSYCEFETWAFTGCSALEEVVLGYGFDRIYDEVFTECDNLKKVTMPSTLTYIGSGVFTQTAIDGGLTIYGVEDSYAEDYAASKWIKFVAIEEEEPEPDPTPTSDPDDVILGDLNGDAAINAGDALVVLKSVAGMETLTETQLVAGDVNKDEAVNASDALQILKYVAGMITEF